MTLGELRLKYINFFKNKNHKEISGKSIIPENDPTALFNTAGMQPLVVYLLGEEHPEGKRLVNVQKCIRTIDIESVGDDTHLTFFEMLGNWSIRDYFKDEAIKMSFEFLTEELNIKREELYISVFAGEGEIPRDEESANVWKSLGIPESRIFYLGKEYNWWGPVGSIGPCGPDTEMFIDTKKEKCSPNCDITCSCGKYVEIWNDVFMQYEKKADGSLVELSHKCVDTGMGIERTLTFLSKKNSVYETDAFLKIIKKIEELSGKKYGESDEVTKAMRIVADHSKASIFILADDYAILPSNINQGYVLRRLIRRAIRYARKLGINKSFLLNLVDPVEEIYKDFYKELTLKKEYIKRELSLEEERFFKALTLGEREFFKKIKNLNTKEITAEIVFNLYDTYGFPLELTEELARENGFSVDLKGFKALFEEHQLLSKKAGDKIFKGGLADHSDLTTKLHTATHLLHKALQIVLGEHAKQRGSNITSDRLRFDFTHHSKMSESEIAKVEKIVNDVIKKGLEVEKLTMTLAEAKKMQAMALFGHKYDEVVSVYKIGDFSLEVCGGPHVTNTSELGKFKIIKEQSSSSGVRRIKAILE